MLKEFKEFISRGNVIDLAVGIIIGAAFTTIVNSLVNDIIMPPIGLVLGGIDFSNFFVTLKGGVTRRLSRQGGRRGGHRYGPVHQFGDQVCHRGVRPSSF